MISGSLVYVKDSMKIGNGVTLFLAMQESQPSPRLEVGRAGLRLKSADFRPCLISRRYLGQLPDH